jgi:hypothetical protein
LFQTDFAGLAKELGDETLGLSRLTEMPFSLTLLGRPFALNQAGPPRFVNGRESTCDYMEILS